MSRVRRSSAWSEQMAQRVMRRVRRAARLSWCLALGTVLVTAGALLVPRAVQSETELYDVALVDLPAPVVSQFFEGHAVTTEPVQVRLRSGAVEADRAAPVDIDF